MVDRGAQKRFLTVHLGAAAALALFPLYRWMMASVLSPSGCFLHDYLFLYCAFCGGTRSLEALIGADVVAAFRYNALVPCLVLLTLVLDVIALIRLLRGEKKLLVLPKRSWIALVGLLVGYALLRNYLMIAEGYDPLGDLGAFWR